MLKKCIILDDYLSTIIVPIGYSVIIQITYIPSVSSFSTSEQVNVVVKIIKILYTKKIVSPPEYLDI